MGIPGGFGLNPEIVWGLLIALGLLGGGIMYSAWLPEKFHGIDVASQSSDGNPGAFNVFQAAGPKLGIVCLMLDMAKGFLPVFLAVTLMDPSCLFFTMVLISPVLGHALGLFNHRRGGKGIATSFGEMLGLCPLTPVALVILSVLYVVFSTILKITPNRRRSVITYTLFACIAVPTLIFLHLPFTAGGCLGISTVVLYKHLHCQKQPYPQEASSQEGSVSPSALRQIDR